MLKYFMIAIAICFCFTASNLFAEPNSIKGESQMNQPPPNKLTTEKKAKNAKKEISQENKTAEAEDTKIQSKAQTKHSDDKTKLRTMTRYEWSNVIIMFLIMAITATYAYFSYLQWCTLREQVTQMKEAVIAAHRPWLSVRLEIGSGLTFNEHGAHIKIRYKIKNVGQHPAIGIDYIAMVYPPLGLNEPWSSVERDIFNIVERMGRGSIIHSIGQSLFGGEEYIFENILDLDWNIIKAKQATFGNILQPYIVGCVYYRFISGGEIHKTGFAIDIRRKQTMTSREVHIDFTAGDVPAEMLELHDLPLGHYTD